MLSYDLRLNEKLQVTLVSIKELNGCHDDNTKTCKKCRLTDLLKVNQFVNGFTANSRVALEFALFLVFYGNICY